MQITKNASSAFVCLHGCKHSWTRSRSRRFKPAHPKGNQSWIFIGRTDAEAETPILWPPDVKSHLTGKDPDGGRDWRREEKGTTEDEMAGWHHRLRLGGQVADSFSPLGPRRSGEGPVSWGPLLISAVMPQNPTDKTPRKTMKESEYRKSKRSVWKWSNVTPHLLMTTLNRRSTFKLQKMTAYPVK